MSDIVCLGLHMDRWTVGVSPMAKYALSEWRVRENDHGGDDDDDDDDLAADCVAPVHWIQSRAFLSHPHVKLSSFRRLLGCKHAVGA